MEVDKGPVPQSVVEDDQHTMKYYQALPYAQLLDGEAEEWLNEICTNLAICVEARDFAPGAASWVKRLSSYISMKHSIPRETRAKLAELLYSMAFMPGMDTALMETWASMCARLIKKPKHLGPEDLVLPWRPLYDTIERFLFPKERQKTLLSESKHVSAVIRLLELAQRFFPPSAAQEILDEFLPQFALCSIRDALRVLGYLALFLPVSVPRNSQTHAALSDTAMHPKEYVPTLFSMWSTLTNSPTCDAQFVDLLARITESNISDPYTAEIGVFNRQQVKYLFTVGMRMMNLPVGSRENGSSGGGSTGFGTTGQKTDLRGGNALMLRRKPERFKSLAKFVVYNIIPEGQDGESYVMTLLSEMIQATELYYHPSNHGTWTYYLTAFIQHLATEFLKRWREEEKEDCPTPKERRLTAALRKQFVLTLRPLTYLSMFGKDHYVIGSTEATIKALAWLEPGLMFPGLLERIYPSLETLTETHRTTSALGILADVALPLFSRDHYPAGGKHLLPLLHLATPGVDMNDPLKAITSLMFIISALSTVPVRDLTMSGSGEPYSGGYSELRYEGMDLDGGDAENELPREEEDKLCKATTGEFEEWVAKFLRRVFTIFENLPQHHQQRKQNGSTETGLTSMLEYACDTLFGQLSNDLYDMALRMVIDFASQQVLPNAIHAAGLLCGSIASANPAKAAKRLIPLCIANISSELEHGAASTMINSESSTPIQSDSTLHWYQCILYHVVLKMGPELLKYKKDIVNIIQEMISKCRTRRGFMWSAELLQNCLGTLLQTYARDRRSLNPEDWDNDELMNNSHMLWGKTGDTEKLSIDWHVPSAEEKAFAVELLETFLVPSIAHVRQKIANYDESQPGNVYEQANDFCRHLAVIYGALRGSTCISLDDGTEQGPRSDHEHEDGEGSDSIREQPRLIAGYAFTDPSDPMYAKVHQIRKDMGQLIHEALQFFLLKREDDLESLKMVIDITRAFMDDAGVDRKYLDQEKGQYVYAKAVIKVPKAPKQYPRSLLVRRAEIHHLQRLRYNAQGRTRAALHDTLFKDLLDLSLSSYAEIRKLSQNTLSATAKNFNGSKSLIVPVILDMLQSKYENGDKERHSNRIKGSLYLLRHRSILMPCLRDWRYIPTFALALCGTQHEDKPSIQEMIRKVFVDYVTQFNPRSFRVLTPEGFDGKVEAIRPIGASDIQARVDTLQKKVLKQQDKKLNSYQELMKSLLDFVHNSKVHWRYCSMAANLIELFIRPDIPPDAGIAAFANECMVSELPPMRRIGVGITTNMLYYIEHRTFAQGNEDTIIMNKVEHPLKREFRVADKNPRYSEEEYLRIFSQPLNDENVQQWPLIDDTRVGWYVWPKVYQGFVLPSATALVPDIEKSSVDAYQKFHKVFTSKEHWKKLQKYMSQEVSRAQEDIFNQANVALYTSLFRLYGDAPIEAMKENFVSLCKSSDQKAHQRAAAELAAGIIRGTEHWPAAKTEAVWTWLAPLLESTFANITPDSLSYWETFVKSCAYERDPRRIRPLVTLILDAKIDPTSDAAFAEARKLILAHVLISTMGWHADPLVHQLLGEYISHVDHPYKQVREVLGGNISNILERQWAPSLPDVQTLLSNNAKAEHGGVGNVPTRMASRTAHHVEQLLTKLDQWHTEAKDATEIEDTKTYTNASKTVICWLRKALGQYDVAGTLPYIMPLWSRLFAMQEFHDDQDLQHMATSALNKVAQYSYPPSMVVKMVDEFMSILMQSGSWRIRTRALPLLQIFFFKNLFSMESSHVLQVMNSVSGMLLDTQIEVRQMAAVTLGGLVRCSQREAITTVQAQYSKLLEAKLPKRRRDRETGKVIEMPGFADALLKKHAGALGLSCLVSAFPYEVPKWMPEVLCELANCMSDPAEIQSTIRKTFSDFRRTHSDTWHEDMGKFTEDQLSILSDMLISPSYYA